MRAVGKFRVLLAGVLMGCFLMSVSVFAAGDAVYNQNKIMLDGMELAFSGALISVAESPGYVSNYMPLRAVLEALGYYVEWDVPHDAVLLVSPGLRDEPSGASDSVTPSGVKSAQYNESIVMLDGWQLSLTAPLIRVVGEASSESSSNCMPVRAVLEAIGYKVEWNGANKTVMLPPPRPPRNPLRRQEKFGSMTLS